MTMKTIGDVADIAAGAVVIGTLLEWIPPVAGALTILWLVIRVGEWARVAIWKRPPR